jgi:hypothetical protein
MTFRDRWFLGMGVVIGMLLGVGSWIWVTLTL